MSETGIESMENYTQWHSLANDHKENIEVNNDILNKFDNFSVIHNPDKIDIMGVYCDIKPFCTVDGFTNQEEVKQITTIVEEMGLKTDTVFWKDFYGQYEIRIAKSEETLQKAKEIDLIFDSGDTKNAQTELGKLYGYSETSSQAFENPQLRLDKKEEERLRRKSLAAYYCDFVFSKDHYREEISSYGEKIMLTIKNYLPNTHKSIIKEWKHDKSPIFIKGIKKYLL